MRRAALICFAGLILVGVVLIQSTVAALPERVATHFGGGGAPNAWMTRDGYRIFMLAFVTLLPLSMVAMAGWLPRLFPNATNIPNRQYWMAPERRSHSLDFLLSHACWLGCLMVLFILGIHALLLETNSGASPRLWTAPFVVMVGAFLFALVVWILVLRSRFRRPA
jgi:serine/threonine-protein kinase